uniref:Fizzy-related protein homolog n=1 Tax=Ascaris suum TaxID=6253 RepID=F1KWM8_ASCSU
MIPLSDYERRFLGQHNSSTSPQKLLLAQGVASPQITPTKYRQDGGDRYIPLRPQSNTEWATRFASIATSSPDAPNQFKRPSPGSGRPSPNSTSSGNTPSAPTGAAATTSDDSRIDSVAHRALLRNELLKDNIDDVRSEFDSPDVGRMQESSSAGLFKFGQKTPTKYGDPSTSSANRCLFGGPLSDDSQRLLKSPRKPQRKVPKNPYKVLDAPDLQDDFYLNLVDWSSQNMLSVGLNTCVYLWSAFNSQVVKLCDLGSENDTVTSVQWADKGDLLAVGTNKGITQIWDVHAQKKLHELSGHASRIGCLAWNAELICSGSRDRFIIQRDIRQPAQCPERRLNAHRQEVCGLRWSPDRQYLASGGNDNQLLVWSLRKNDPFQVYTEHNAAVKALAWSPHHHGLLVSGGGTADRCLRFWNTLTGQPLQCIDTGSQVCNVAWSKHSSELVSTHGYSYNQVIIWKYPSLQPVTKLTGHQYRVLYLAMSPDGESIVTGAGDETLRFWHVFSKSGQQRTARSKLNLLSSIR